MAAVSTEKILRDQREVLIAALKEADQKFVQQLTDNQLISLEEQTLTDNLDGVTAGLRARYLFELINNNILSQYYGEGIKRIHYEHFLQMLGKFEFSAKFTLLLQSNCPDDDALTLTQPQGLLTASHIPILSEALADCTHKWEEIAIALSRSPSDIEECRRGSSNQIRLHNVLTIWQQKTKSACLKNVKDALESKLVGLSVEADSLRTKLKEQIKSKMQATHQPHRHPVTAAGHVTRVEVADGKCTLLGAEVPYSEPASYQWMKDGHKLTDDLDYSGVHTDILLITFVHQGMEGKYSCKIKFDRKEQNEEDYLVSVTYSPHKKCLLDRYLLQQEVPSDSWPPVGVSTYIQLALIHDETISRINDYSIRGDMDDILKEKDLTNYEEIFDSHIQGGLVLVEGRPGSGKTTLTHKLVRDWAKGPHILRGSKLVFLISLRMVTTTKKDKTLSDILEIFCNNLEEVTEMLESSHGEGVCFIIDGLDEYSNKDSVITKLLNKRTFSSYLYKAMVIVASRPIGTAELRHARRVSKRIEVLGFSKKKISDYVHVYDFNSGSSDELEAYLQKHVNVYHMCYLPVHTAMICYIYDRNGEISNTETKIYETFTLLTIKRKLEREGIKDAPKSLRKLDGTLKKCFVDICKLAFEMTTNSTQTISQNETNVCLSDGSGCDVRSLGLVTVDSTAELLGYEDLYAFLHLTFQEYLAACHIAAQEEKEQTRIIEQHKDKREMLMVWKFYCGMTKFTDQNIDQMNLITSSTSMNYIYKIQCAFESQQPSVCAHFLPDNSLNFTDHVFTPIDYHAISYVVNNHKSAIHLTLDNCVMNTGTAFDSLTFNNIKSVSFTNMNTTELTTLCLFLLKLPMMESLSIDQMLSEADVSAFTDNSSTLSNIKVLKLQMPFNIWNSNIETKRLFSKNLKLIQYSYNRNNHISHYQTLSYLLSFQCKVEPLTEIPEDFLINQNIDSRVTLLCVATLQLINCNMKDSDVHYLLDSGIKYESLRLDVNGITDHGAGLLSDLVRRCTGLKCLSLRCNQIRDEGAMALAAVLHGNTRLVELDLQCNAIGDEGAVAIAKAVKDFPSEFQLLLFNVYVTSKGAEEVLKYRPTTMIKEDRLGLTWEIINKADHTAIEQAFKCFTNLATINWFSLIRRDLFHKTFLKELQHCFYIKTLILRYIRISDTCVETLVAESHLFCSLEVLDFSNNDIGPRGAAVIARWMQCGRQVIPQDILTCLHKTTKSFFLRTFNTTHSLHISTCDLRTLNLGDNMIGVKGAAVLACGLACSKLQSLDLSKNQIQDDGAQALALGIQHCQTIHTVILDYNRIHVPFKHCYHLKKLSLRWNNISDKVHSIISELKCCHQLQILDVGYNKLGKSGATAIGEYLKYWKHLKELNIESNFIWGCSNVLAAGLECCKELLTLDFSNNNMYSSELIKVLQSLKKCTSLQILKLEGNKFDVSVTEVLVSLIQSLPNIQQLNLSKHDIRSHEARILADGLRTCGEILNFT